MCVPTATTHCGHIPLFFQKFQEILFRNSMFSEGTIINRAPRQSIQFPNEQVSRDNIFASEGPTT